MLPTPAAPEAIVDPAPPAPDAMVLPTPPAPVSTTDTTEVAILAAPEAACEATETIDESNCADERDAARTGRRIVMGFMVMRVMWKME